MGQAAFYFQTIRYEAPSSGSQLHLFRHVLPPKMLGFSGVGAPFLPIELKAPHPLPQGL